MKKRVIRIIYISVGVILFTMLSGTAYERIATLENFDKFPPPGRMIKLDDGHSVQLACRGRGAPVVVFEAGGDTFGSLSWAAVQDSVARFTRSCAYSRSGIMWSERREGKATGQVIVRELHETLGKAGEKPPFVMVGQSMGGPLITLYTKYYGEDVAGLVFVDSSHPDQTARMKREIPSFSESDFSVLEKSLMITIARTGLLRLLLTLSGGLPNQPSETVQPWIAYASTSSGMFAEREMLKEYFIEVRSFIASGASPVFANRPLFVLSAMAPLRNDERFMMGGLSEEEGKRSKEIWKVLQEEEATWSFNSRHLLLPDAGHYIQFDRPDTVISAIQWVVDQVRENR